MIKKLVLESLYPNACIQVADLPFQAHTSTPALPPSALPWNDHFLRRIVLIVPTITNQLAG